MEDKENYYTHRFRQIVWPFFFKLKVFDDAALSMLILIYAAFIKP